MPEPGQALLEIRNLKKYFPVRRGVLSRVVSHVKAVDDVSFTITKGETFGLVGESGCGKTTTGRAVLRLIEPDSGEIRFEGVDMLRLGTGALRALRRDMQIIFQDPFAFSHSLIENFISFFAFSHSSIGNFPFFLSLPS